MPPQNAFRTPFAGPFPQTHFLPVLGALDDAAHQSGLLGLLRKPAVLSISLVSRILLWKSSSSKGPERPTFSNSVFFAKAPAHRAGIHLVLSSLRLSLRALRSLRFLFPLLCFRTKPVARRARVWYTPPEESGESARRNGDALAVRGDAAQKRARSTGPHPTLVREHGQASQLWRKVCEVGVEAHL